MINEYHIQDAKNLSQFVKDPVDLIISSPPYFDMKDYGAKGQIGFGQSYKQYLAEMEAVFAECGRVISETGSMWLIVDTLKRDGEQLLLPFHLVEAAQRSGWRLQETVIWKKDRTLPYSTRGEMRNIFEYVLFLVRNDLFKYHPERVKSFDFKQWWVKYPERYSVSGKAPTDVWEFPIPVQGSWGSQYVRHFCPLPENLVVRIIDLCSDSGDTVLDPFAGSGAVLAAAYRCDRHFVGCDLSPEFKKMFDRYLPTLAKRKQDESQVSQAKVAASAIRKLRFLKLPSAMLKALRKESLEAFSLIHGVVVQPTEEAAQAPYKHWTVNYLFYVDDNMPDGSVDKIKRLFDKPPLSKYQIEPRISFERGPFREPECDCWHYRWDATYLPPARSAAETTPRIAATFCFDAAEEKLISRFL